MTHPRRVLAIVDMGRSGREVARHAWGIAVRQGARFALGHVADWGQDLGCDEFSPLTPHEVELRLTKVIERRLRTLANHIGAAEAATLVSFPGASHGLGELAGRWQPDLVVVGSGNHHGLAGSATLDTPEWSCAALVIEVPASGFLPSAARRIADTLAPWKPAHRLR
jgi:nucleotide-binding universal stress UspA family protein